MNPSTTLRVLRQKSSSAVRVLQTTTPAPRRIARTYATKQAGPAAQFYRTFTRPIGKVLVLAVFTYQLAYWSWTKLEADEHRAETDGEQLIVFSTKYLGPKNEYIYISRGRKRILLDFFLGGRDLRANICNECCSNDCRARKHCKRI
ncbi:hypothetical protein V8C37DRAFT_369556 [Trichoderma ceciliae]